MTNFEKIKNMTIEEFTSFLWSFDPCPAENDGFLCGDRNQCRKCIKKYLESEVDK